MPREREREHVPTYEELVALRAQEWQQAQARAAVALSEQQKALEAMPDVAHAPVTGSRWSGHGVVCLCGHRDFSCTRWVTCNGVRHRTELVCQACGVTGTWDWTTKGWLP